MLAKPRKPRSSPLAMRAIRWFFIALGLGFMYPLALVLYVQVPFWYSAQTATATVVAMEALPDYSRRNNRGKPSMAPIVRFVTVQGDSIQVNSLSGSNPPSFHMGEQIQLHYNPAKPSQIVLPTFFSRWGGLLVGSAFAGVGFLFFRAGLQPDRRKKKSVLKKSSSGIKK